MIQNVSKIICYCKIIWLLAIVQIISCQRISSTLLEGNRTCPGAQMNFTCTTNGSLVMSWRSDEYIGPNGAQLEFTSADGVGNRMTSSINPSTFAILIRVNGSRVVESSLTITVSDSYQTASVTCSEVGQGASTITFTLLALPGIPQNVTANMISLTSEDCVILLQWMPPSVAESSVNHYVVDSSSGRFITRDTSVEIALLIHHCNSTTYIIRIHAVDCCDRDGPSTNDMLGLLLTNTTVLPPVTESIKGQHRSSVAAIVGGVFGGGIALGIIIFLIALSVVLLVVRMNRVPVVEHLQREQLEDVRVFSDAPDPPSMAKDPDHRNKKLKKLLYVVRRRDIHDISSKPLPST